MYKHAIKIVSYGSREKLDVHLLLQENINFLIVIV